MSAVVLELPLHSNMTPEQVLEWAHRQGWDEVIICGYRKDSAELSTVSSHMSRETALWIIEHTKLYVMDRLDE